MKRINTPTASSGKFVDGNPSIGRKATQLSAEWCNNVQEELCNAIHALTGADPTGAAEMNELGAALGGIVGKVLVSDEDTSPNYLLFKLVNANATGAIGDVGFVQVDTNGGLKLKAVIMDGRIQPRHIANKTLDESCIKDGEITRPLMALQSVGGGNLAVSVVSRNVNVAVNSGETKTKICDLESHVRSGGLVDINVKVGYEGSGYVPSGVSLTVEDESGRIVCSWSVNDGGSISGVHSKRMVGKDNGIVGVSGEMFSLYINNGLISYGWSVSVDVDGIVFR